MTRAVNHQFREILEQQGEGVRYVPPDFKGESTMKVTFLGTGTSMGVPVAGGFGMENRSNDYRDERTRSSVWVQTREASILIDVGPEFRLQSLRSGIRFIDMVLITHEHFDHIGGMDDLRPFNYMQKAIIPVITTPGCAESIKRRYDYMFGPNKTPGSVDLAFETSSDPVQFKDCLITPLPVTHGTLSVYGFRINDFAYITDANYIPEETYRKIEGCKVLVLNALRWKPEHPTHFTISQAVEASVRSGIPEIYFVHMSSYVQHGDTNLRLPKHIKLAYDQQVVYL